MPKGVEHYRTIPSFARLLSLCRSQRCRKALSTSTAPARRCAPAHVPKSEMPKGVEHLGGGNTWRKAIKVPKSEMPKGVEHQTSVTGFSARWVVPKSEMPKGVEHIDNLSVIAAEKAVPKSEMPKGVEHLPRKRIAETITRCRSQRCRKALSTRPERNGAENFG